MSILPRPGRLRTADPWMRRVFLPPAVTGDDTSQDHDESAARHVAGYGFEDFAGSPHLPADLAERLEADLAHDAKQAGGGE